MEIVLQGIVVNKIKPVMKLLVPVSSKKPKASGTICDGDCTSKIVVHQRQTLVRRLHVPLDSLQKGCEE